MFWPKSFKKEVADLRQEGEPVLTPTTVWFGDSGEVQGLGGWFQRWRQLQRRSLGTDPGPAQERAPAWRCLNRIQSARAPNSSWKRLRREGLELVIS